MRNTYTLQYQPGWNGGFYTIDGKPFNTKERPEAVITVDGEEHEAIYKDTTGSDYDHGHNYDWKLVDIGISDGYVLPRFLSVAALRAAGKLVEIRFIGANSAR